MLNWELQDILILFSLQQLETFTHPRVNDIFNLLKTILFFDLPVLVIWMWYVYIYILNFLSRMYCIVCCLWSTNPLLFSFLQITWYVNCDNQIFTLFITKFLIVFKLSLWHVCIFALRGPNKLFESFESFESLMKFHV